MILAKPFGGLCNRLRVIDSSRTLANRLGTETHVIWKTAPDMVAPFADLFEPAADLVFRQDGRFRYVQSPESWPRPARPLVRLSNRALGVTHAYFERDMPSIWRGDVDLASLRPSDNVLFCTCQSLRHWKELDYSWLTPQPSIADDIRREVSRFEGRRTIGVHVRRSDHVISTRESPLELFLARMSEERRRDPSTMFFLATDDPATEKAMVDRFGPNAVLTHAKTFGRESVAAIRDAVLDLFVLASTEQLLVSADSSFSETASRIGRIPMTVLRRSVDVQ